MTPNSFEALMEPLRKALAREGYTTPTPIQQQAIPHLLAERDLLGCAQTGTGKTAAFALPILQHLSRHRSHPAAGRPRALILSPTRELAAQIGESLSVYGRHLDLTHTVIFGGVNQYHQAKALRRGLDIVVATPGRLLDLMNQRLVHLDRVEHFVLDEADRMLDMGFLPAVRKVVRALPDRRHSLFFSATMPPVVAELAGELLTDPIRIDIDPETPAVERIEQRICFVDKANKDALLLDLLGAQAMEKAIVFTRTKHGADKVVRRLHAAGIAVSAIHGNKSQAARTEALRAFRSGRIRALVATDLAARGLDVDGITHVINYDLPEEAETYVHRIGRTARAGADGDAVSFCAARERDMLGQIEALLRRAIPVEMGHGYHSESARLASGSASRPEPRGGGRRTFHRRPCSHQGSNRRRNRTAKAQRG